MSALTFVATFLIVIPLPWTGGYFNLGDVAVILSGLLFGPTVGGIAGAIGPAMADFVAGYSVFVPATLVAKGLEGVVAGILVRRLSDASQSRAKQYSVVTIGLYGLTGLLFVLYMSFIEQTPQAWMVSVTWAAVFLAFSALIFSSVLRGQWSQAKAGTLAGAVAATLMVSVYFLYEQYLMGVPAVFEVIPNLLQGMLGSSLAGIVYGHRGIRERTESFSR